MDYTAVRHSPLLLFTLDTSDKIIIFEHNPTKDCKELLEFEINCKFRGSTKALKAYWEGLGISFLHMSAKMFFQQPVHCLLLLVSSI